jgi:hypothetical protein
MRAHRGQAQTRTAAAMPARAKPAAAPELGPPADSSCVQAAAISPTSSARAAGLALSAPDVAPAAAGSAGAALADAPK